MKKVLIVEDDNFKAESLKNFLLRINNQTNVKIVGSLVEAVQAVNDNVYDLVLVDMAIPSHPPVVGGGAPISLLTGGIEVLLELSYLDRNDPCIVVTQYPDIEISGRYYDLKQAVSEFKNQLGCDVKACIEYQEGNLSWEAELKRVLNIS